MQLTIQMKLIPDKTQEQIIQKAMEEYISLVNDIVDYSVGQGSWVKLTSASVKAKFPSCVKNQAIRDANSVYGKYRKTGIQSELKKPVAIWNSQNYTLGEDYISLPFWVDQKSKRISVKTMIPKETFLNLKERKLGTLRITKKNGKYIAQIAYSNKTKVFNGSETMGVDLGIKCPAVAVTSNGKTKFYGNGRQNKYVRRRYAKHRKKLGKAKKLNAICKLANKEQRWMKDQDHKISRTIVNDAIKYNVDLIKLESLSGIRATTRKSRKNNHSLHNWSFYRLANFIEYKAKLAGIQVEYVNPAYTSQTCPACGQRHHAKDRTYKCSCGYRSHRDRVGAVNILAA